MKQTVLSIVTMLAALVATAQMPAQSKMVNYEAASWKTWLLDDPQLATIPSPPGAARSKVELRSLKQAMAKLDKKKLTEITYWNAGAPAYRWNQIVAQLV